MPLTATDPMAPTVMSDRAREPFVPGRGDDRDHGMAVWNRALLIVIVAWVLVFVLSWSMRTH